MSRALPLVRDLRPPDVTRGTVHVRAETDLRVAHHALLLALLPCALMGLRATGAQAARGHAHLGAAAPAGVRTDLLRALGLAPDDPSLAATLVHGALYLAPALLLAWAAGWACEAAFARARGRPRAPGLALGALLFTLLLHPATPWWQVALGMAFGAVFAKEVFGGTGRGFASAPAVGALFLAVAWPQTAVGDPLWPGLRGHAGPALLGNVAGAGVDALRAASISWSDAFLGDVPGTLGTTSTLACLLGGAYLLVRGLGSWLVPAGAACGALVAVGLCGLGAFALGPAATLGWSWHVVLGGFAFGAVFLLAEPSTAPLTGAGRLLAGALYGGMVVFARVANPLHPDGVLGAVLLAQVLAPLADHATTRAYGALRRLQRG